MLAPGSHRAVQRGTAERHRALYRMYRALYRMQSRNETQRYSWGSDHRLRRPYTHSLSLSRSLTHTHTHTHTAGGEATIGSAGPERKPPREAQPACALTG